MRSLAWKIFSKQFWENSDDWWPSVWTASSAVSETGHPPLHVSSPAPSPTCPPPHQSPPQTISSADNSEGGFVRLTLSLYLSHCESPYFENLATTQNIEEGKFRFPLLAFLTVPALTGQTGVAHQEEREERRGQLECSLTRELYSSGDSQQRIVDHLIACFALLYCTVLYCTVAVHYQVLLSSKNSFNIICTEWWGVQMDTTPSNSLETQIIAKMHFILSTWLERSTVTPYWTFHHFDCFDQTIHYWNSI